MRNLTLILLLISLFAISCQNIEKQPPVPNTTSNNIPLTECQDSTCTEKLCLRAFRKDTAGVRQLLEEGCSSTEIALNGHTHLYPLKMASDPVTIKLLLDNGFNPNQEIKDDLTPFHNAAAFFSPNILQMMWEKGADVNKNIHDPQHVFDTPLLSAIYGGKVENVKWLTKHGADVNYRTKDLSPLTQAVGFGGYNVVKILLEHGADPNAKFNPDYEDCYFCPESITPIFYYLYEAKPDKRIIDLLINHGADINYVSVGGYTVLDVVDSLETAKYLLQKGAAIETKKTSALACAAFRNNVDLVKLYLKQGANPNYKGIFNYTPLYACLASPYDEYYQHPEKTLEIIQLLLDHGANPAIEIQQNGEETASALSFAKTGQRMLITEFFIKKGYMKWKDIKFEHCPEYNTERKVIAPSGLVVRSAPSLKAPILGKLENGTVIHTCRLMFGGPTEVDGIKASWSPIEYNGSEGYVFNGFLQEV